MKLIAAASLCVVFISGCNLGRRIEKDKNGKLPRDILEEFVALCKSKKYDEAELLWTKESIDEISRIYHEGGMVAMCDEIASQELRYGAAKHGKTDYVIHIKADDPSGNLKKHFYFTKRDGSWKLIWPTAYD